MGNYVADNIYDVAEIVLSKKEGFTLEDIQKEMDSLGINISMSELEKIIKGYMENGIVVEQGFSYILSEWYGK